MKVFPPFPSVRAVVGSGPDGAVSLSSGTRTLTDRLFPNALSVATVATLYTAGCIVIASASIVIAGTVDSSGQAAAGAAAGAAWPADEFGYSAGGAGASGAGGAANASALGVSQLAGVGAGGAGGAGSGHAGGGAWAGTSLRAPASALEVLSLVDFAISGLTTVASPGGGGGGGDGTSPGGGGGAGALPLILVAPTIQIVTGAVLRAVGGAGAAGTAGNAGGGGGGGGGAIYLVCNELVFAGTVANGGGAGGVGHGTGTAGSAGGAGPSGYIQIPLS
jgi:hypothetical protein